MAETFDDPFAEDEPADPHADTREALRRLVQAAGGRRKDRDRFVHLVPVPGPGNAPGGPPAGEREAGASSGRPEDGRPSNRILDGSRGGRP